MENRSALTRRLSGFVVLLSLSWLSLSCTALQLVLVRYNVSTLGPMKFLNTIQKDGRTDNADGLGVARNILPNELLLQIAEGLDSVKATYAFFLTNRRLASLLTPVLLDYAIHEDRHCVTALYLAATNADVKMIRLLLEKGTNIRITDDDEIRRSVTDDNVDKLLKLLLEQGAHSIIQDRPCGGTALHWAADYGHEGVTRLLLERGMNVAVKDLFGRTALQWAAVEGHETIVRLLLENGVDVNGKDYDSVTALHRAAEHGLDNVVRLLLEKGANIDAQDSERATPLHWATEFKNLATARLLIELGADHTIKNRRGVTALDDVTDEKTLQLALASKKDKGIPRRCLCLS